ncbi:MAG: hypothetical protein JRE70_14440 [Deltaproteobacteria bacterium]|nr:hypothetical protein [Deltaproteobacteria bacterium]
MQVACYLATAIFGLFTYWQFNDLEQYGTQFWYGWVLAYGATAGVALISARRPLPRELHIGCATAAFIAAAVRMRSIEWEKTIFYNETNPAGNETGGLLIVGVWFAFLALSRSSTRAPRTE